MSTDSGLLGAMEIPGFMLGVIQSNADLTAKQFYAVELKAASGSGLTGSAMDLPASAGLNVVGILQNAPQLGEAAEVMVTGVSKAVAGNTVSVNSILAALANGKLQIATTGQYAIAKSLAAGVVNDVIPVLLCRYGIVA